MCMLFTYIHNGMTLSEVITSIFDGKLNNMQRPLIDQLKHPHVSKTRNKKKNTQLENDTISTS